MGIKDLLKFMKPYVEPIHINKYAGKRVGIDAYSWLHKGAYSCSMELCLNTEGDKKLQYLNYCMHRINLLRHYKITPVVVFDGGNLPSKAATEEDRHSKRKANRDLAMAKLKEGNVNAASELFQRAVSITPSMAHQLIQILKSENIEFIVAPYEADAQLAYLSNLEAEKGGIEVVISEDSDLLAYGCPCVVFKMDRNGNGEEIVLDKVFDSVSIVPNFQNFDKELFAGMCVLAGCDFLSSVPGIGIAKAYSFVSKYRNLDRVLSVLKFEKGKKMPEDYLRSFKEALAVFQHAQIFDINLKRLKHLKPLPQSLLLSLDEELDFLGPDVPPSIAIAIAEGKLDPCTKEAFNLSSSANIHLKIPKIPPFPIQLSRPDPPSVSSSCFSVVSAHKTQRKRITAMDEASNASEESKQTPAFDENKYLCEATELGKLAVPLKNEDSDVIKIVYDKTLLTVPNNNPFKKQKVEEIMIDQLDSVTDEVSVVTEIESLEVISLTPESQQSMDSKSYTTFKAKKRVISEKELKRSSCKNSENKRSSILNFFSPV